MRIRNYIATLTLILGAGSANAQGIAVYDHSQNLNQIKELAHMAEQIQQMQKQYQAMTGTRNMGKFANNDLAKKYRKTMPQSINDMIDIMRSGNTAEMQWKAKYGDLQNAYKPLTPSEINPQQPDYPTAKAYEYNVNSTFATLSAAEQQYASASNRVDTYNEMLTELDNTQDLKASTDLQSRAVIENGIVLNELLQSISLQNQLLAAQNNGTLSYEREIYDITR